MVFVFGIDLPLVELIFVLTLMLIGLFGLLVYIIIKQRQLNERLEEILSKENVELKSLKTISKEEKSETKLLRIIRTELDKLIYGEALLKLKTRRKIRRRAIALLKEISKVHKRKPSKKKKKPSKIKQIIIKPKQLTIIKKKIPKSTKPKHRKPKKPKKKKPKKTKQKKTTKKPKSVKLEGILYSK